MIMQQPKNANEYLRLAAKIPIVFMECWREKRWNVQWTEYDHRS